MREHHVRAEPGNNWLVEWKLDSNRCFFQLCLPRGGRALNDRDASVISWWAGGMPMVLRVWGVLREAGPLTMPEPWSREHRSEPLYRTGVRSPEQPQISDTWLKDPSVPAPAQLGPQKVLSGKLTCGFLSVWSSPWYWRTSLTVSSIHGVRTVLVLNFQ